MVSTLGRPLGWRNTTLRDENDSHKESEACTVAAAPFLSMNNLYCKSLHQVSPTSQHDVCPIAACSPSLEKMFHSLVPKNLQPSMKEAFYAAMLVIMFKGCWVLLWVLLVWWQFCSHVWEMRRAISLDEQGLSSPHTLSDSAIVCLWQSIMVLNHQQPLWMALSIKWGVQWSKMATIQASLQSFVEREKGYFPLNLAFGFGACSLLLSLVSSSSLVIKKARVAFAVKWIVWCDQVYKDIISVCVINFIAWFKFLVLISVNNFSINIIDRQCQPYQCGIIELIFYRYFKT